MAKPLRCYLGFHRWQFVHVPDGDSYRPCRLCGKERIPRPIKEPGVGM